MKVCMLPRLEDFRGSESGIRRVVEAYHEYMPAFGVEFVANEAEADIVVGHAGIRRDQHPHVAMLHGLYWTADYKDQKWQHHSNRNIVQSIRYANTITVPSSWVAETIQRDLRVDPFVVEHGIDIDEWEPVDEHGGYVLWNKNRKADVCDPRPVSQLARRFPKGRFLTTFAPDSGVIGNMRVTGVVEHAKMKEMVRHAGVYLATTKETFGIGTLEALAAGVPVLGYEWGGTAQLVDHGETGYLAEPENVDDLAEGLRYCIRHRAQLGANARQAAQHWSWERACEQAYNAWSQGAERSRLSESVAVVIPVYNKEGSVARAIESAIRQSRSPDYIVVVDDGSTDASAEVAREYLLEVEDELVDRGIRAGIIRQRNRGVAYARNRGIGVAGEARYVCCLDADDRIAPDFLATCLEALAADRSLGVAYTRLEAVWPDGRSQVSQWPDEWDFDRQVFTDGNGGNQVPTCCVFRREMWQRLGGYRQRYAPAGAGEEDAEFWLRAGAYGWKAKLVTREPLFLYSVGEGRVAGNPEHRATDWHAWHPWAGSESNGRHPFASYASPANGIAHPVRQYDQPKVSVIIPVGPGHEENVINALDSLEAQTIHEWEAVVVWDSDKDVPGWIERAYPYVCWVRGTGTPRGAGAARNAGAVRARAPFLFFLDADDHLVPEALETMMVAFARRGQLDEEPAIIYSDYVGRARIQDERSLGANVRVLERIDEETGDMALYYRAAEFDCEQATANVPPGTRSGDRMQPYIWCNISCLVPAAWHHEIGGFDERMPSWEDWEYWIRMARAGKCFHRVPEALLVYRFETGGRRARFAADTPEARQRRQTLIEYIQNKFEGEEPVGCSGCGGKTPTASNTATQSMRQLMERRGMLTKDRATQVQVQGRVSVSDDDLIQAQYIDPKGRMGNHTFDHPHPSGTNYGMRSNGRVYAFLKQDVQHWLEEAQRTGHAPIARPVDDEVTQALLNVPRQPRQPPAAPTPRSEQERDEEAARQQEEEIEAALDKASQMREAIKARAAQPAQQSEQSTEPQPEPQPVREFALADLPLITDAVAERMREAGLDTPQAIFRAGASGLTAIKGIGNVTAERILDYLDEFDVAAADEEEESDSSEVWF